MSASTKLYSKQALTLAEARTVIENSLEVNIDSSDSYDDDSYGRFSFNYKGEPRSMFVFLHSTDFIPDEPHVGFDLGANGHAVPIMRAIAAQLGGWLIENDCNEAVRPVYISAEGNASEKTNSQKLFEFAAKETDFKAAKKIVAFIEEHAEKIAALKLGRG